MNPTLPPLEWETPTEVVQPASAPLEPFASEPPKANLSKEVLRNRATKADIAVGAESPGIDELISQMQSGLEDDIRARLVNEEYFKKQKQSEDLVAEYFQQTGMQADGPGEVAYVKQLSESRPDRLATIIEKKYATNRIDLALASDESGSVERADPEKLDTNVKEAVGRIVAKERAQKYREDLEGLYDQQGWFRKALDFSKSAVPLLNTWNLATVAPEGVSSEGAFTKGDVMRQQYRAFFNMDPDRQESYLAELYDKAAADSSQLQYAIEFFAGLESYTAVQARIDNASNLIEGGLELTPLGLVSPLVKSGVSAGIKVGTKVVARKAAQGAANSAVTEGASKGGSSAVAKAAGEAPKAAGPAPGYTRLYRGETPEDPSLVNPGQTRGGYWTTKQSVAGKYGNEVYQIDVPSEASALASPNHVVQGDAAHSIGEWYVDPNYANKNRVRYVEPQTPKEALAESVAEAAAGQRTVNKDGLLSTPVKVGEGSGPHVSVDVPNPKTGGTESVSVPLNDNTRAAARLEATTNDAMRPTVDAVETLASHGDSETAAILEATNQIADEVGKPLLPGDIAGLSTRLKRKLLSFVDPFKSVVGTTQTKDKYKEILRRATEFKDVIKSSKAIADMLLDAWTKAGTSGVIRVSEESMAKIKPLMDEAFRKDYKSAKDSILDIETIRETDASGLRLNGRKFILGRPNKNYFSDYTDAKFHAENIFKIEDGYYAVEPRGGGYVVTVTKILDETDKSYASALINSKTKTRVTWASAFTSYLKGGAASSSEWLATNLKTSAVHANALHTAFADVAKEIRLKTKEEVDSFNQILIDMRDATVTNPQTGEVTRGKWAQDAVEFDRMFKTSFNRPPTEAQTKAYFAVRALHDFDFITRNRILHTDLGRMGVEEFQLFLPVPTEAIPEEGIAASTKWIKHKQTTLMRVVDELPKNQLDNDVLILDADGVTYHLLSKARDGTKQMDEFLAKGYKILQIANPDQLPLRHVTKNKVEFVIARDYERRPLGLDRLPYTEGGHVRTAESNFVKQMRVETMDDGTRAYAGDRVYAGFSTEAESKVWQQNIEKARQLFVAGDDKALSAHLLANTPHTLREFKALFEDKVMPDGEIIPAHFQKDLPFGYVADGQGLNDAAKSHMPELLPYFDGVKDMVDNPNNLFRLLGKKYTGEKDLALQTVVADGGQRAWKFEDARHISPLALLEESAAELSRTLALNDLKHSAAMHWVEEAAPFLETPIEELRANPWAHFYNPQWKGQYVDVAHTRALDAQRENVLSYMGLAKNRTESTVDWVKTKVMNSVYEKFGPEKADWVDENILPNIPDPLRFMRQFAFHTKLGFFNPIQPFIQGQTFFHTLAVTGNPKRAGSALAGVMASAAARQTVQRSVLVGIDKKMQKLGWKAGEWLESHELMSKMKLDVVEGGQSGALDMDTAPKMFQSAGGAFLDKGLIFYNSIDRSIRTNSWHVAFKEFRDKNPTKVITNLEANEILKRQEVLSVNMMRSSNAWWQRGALAPATQFMGYQARIMEQLLGHQLTRAEKSRVMLTYAALYGMPVSLGAATFMQIPGASTDDLRQYALENGIDVNSGVTGMAMNGLAASFINMMTSDENGQNGYLFNIGERVGPGGSRVLRDLVNGDKTIFETFFGASGAITLDAFKHIYPEDGDVIGAMAGAPSKSLNDYANVFSTISTVSNTTKLMWALTTQRNMSRNGVDLGGIDSTSALIRFLTGLEEQRFQDDGLRMKSIKDFADYKKEIAKEYKAQYDAMMGLSIGSPERDEAIKRMRALLEGVDQDTKQSITWQARQPKLPRDESLQKSYSKKFPKSEGNAN